MPTVKRNINSVRQKPLSSPAWKGPLVDGVSQSMICDYLACKERFRVRVIEGLSSPDSFNVSIEFGHMWHLCEEMFSAGKDWIGPLTDYAAELSKRYRQEQSQVLKWYNVVKLHFPIYLGYWSNQEDEKHIEPLLQEVVFKVEYPLQNGKVAFIRGKMDGVDLIPGDGIYLKENKTKSKIDVQSIERQLTNDMQVMTYLTALHKIRPSDWTEEIKGVRYNVIRRPLSGGKGSIRPHQPTKNRPGESMEEFYERLIGVILDDVDNYFERWKCLVGPNELNKFQSQTLDPVINNLADDYEWWSFCLSENQSPYNYKLRSIEYPEHKLRHYRLPYGTYNITQQGGFSDVDDYLNTGSKVGLEVCQNFFPEL